MTLARESMGNIGAWQTFENAFSCVIQLYLGGSVSLILAINQSVRRSDFCV